MGFVADVLGVGNKPEKAARAAGDAQVQAAQIGADTIRDQQRQYREDSAPYAEAGKQGLSALASGLSNRNSDLMRSYSFSDFRNDPDYQFRLNRGMSGLESSAAARGGLMSGAALKSLNEFNRGTFDQQFANERQNFQGEQTNRYGRLFELARLGQNTVAQTGAGGASAAGNIANLQNQAGQSRAGAIIGASNARNDRYAGYQGLIGKGVGAFFGGGMV
jgi:hypothetical protein